MANSSSLEIEHLFYIWIRSIVWNRKKERKNSKLFKKKTTTILCQKRMWFLSACEHLLIFFLCIRWHIYLFFNTHRLHNSMWDLENLASIHYFSKNIFLLQLLENFAYRLKIYEFMMLRKDTINSIKFHWW